MDIGIAGAGGIGFGYAAWLAGRGHAVTLWSPRHDSAAALRSGPLTAAGVLDGRFAVDVAEDAAALARAGAIVIIAVPVNGHRRVAEALVPHLRAGATVLVSSSASLSALYVYECLRWAGREDVQVAALGTTALTARRDGADGVRISALRAQVGVATLPASRAEAMAGLLGKVFGSTFQPDANVLASALSNINPIAHGPLALFNWTRIERAEAWPQYHYLTPAVARVIERLDSERMAIAEAFGVTLRSLPAHFARSFQTVAPDLAGIAAELHAKRGGPPGPTSLDTRFLTEDVPFGLVFLSMLGAMAGLPTPATDTVIAMASLAAGCDFAADNDLVAPLGLADETVQGLLARVNPVGQSDCGGASGA